MQWHRTPHFQFDEKPLETETTWSKFPNRGKATVEQILVSKERNKSKRAGIYLKYLGYSHLWQEKVGAQLCCVPTVHLNYLLGERKNVYLVPVPTIWKNGWPSWTIKKIVTCPYYNKVTWNLLAFYLSAIRLSTKTKTLLSLMPL